METVASAEALILERLPPFGTVSVGIDAAVGTVLRETLTAERDQPPFDRVTMDGIALAYASWAAGRRNYRVGGVQGAGAPALSVSDPETCIEVMTGAVLPTGADTVIPIERLERRGGEVQIAADYEVQPGQFVHQRGSDQLRGQPLLHPGVLIRAPEMALLVAAGRARVQVTRRPRIAIVSNGDELVDVGQPVTDFQVRSSNDRAIAAALAQRGFERSSRALIPDDPQLLETRIRQLHDSHDVVILSGGVSRGKYDYIPPIMQSLAVEMVFHKVSQRPGLPMWFGISAAGKSIFALPGNPVSSLVCLVRYVIPGLERAMGARPKPLSRVALAAPVDFAPALTYFLPVVLQPGADGVLHAQPKPTNTSGDFISLAGTDGFVELEKDQAHFASGHLARFFPW